jgi:hypothetical protein
MVRQCIPAVLTALGTPPARAGPWRMQHKPTASPQFNAYISASAVTVRCAGIIIAASKPRAGS